MQETSKEGVIMVYLDFAAITNCMKTKTLIVRADGQKDTMVFHLKIGHYFKPFIKIQVILIFLLVALVKNLEIMDYLEMYSIE